jgi:tetraprenyl-beta-curcumene synthase
MGSIAWRRLMLAAAFSDAAVRYWLTVYPLVRWHTRRWRRRAAAIPDPVLRRIALDTHRTERGNLEGAAAFAAFAPLRRRAAVVRASVAFQATYDYVDSLAEQPSRVPFSNGRALHEALRVALRPGAKHAAYYRHHPRTDDGGYLRDLVDDCRAAMRRLPSHHVIEFRLAAAVRRMVGYQTRVHSRDRETRALDVWARAHIPPRTELTWWEGAAAAASSLGTFALLAASADPRLTESDAAAIDRAYFPWAGALHVLLDSLVDRSADVASGHCSLVDGYGSADELAVRLDAIATQAFASTLALRRGTRHALIVAAMSAYYLSSPAAELPYVARARQRVLAAAGDLAWPTLAVMRGRRRLAGGAGVSAGTPDPLPAPAMASLRVR